MELYLIDSLASSGRSRFHLASPKSKLFFAASVIFSAITSNSTNLTLALFVTLIALMSFLRLPTLRLLLMTSYLAIFAAIFALSRPSAFSMESFALILKAVTAALSLLILFSTTNYFDIFGLLAKFLPPLITDVLFLTYRSFFVLLKELNDLLMAMRIRGGLLPGRIVSNLKNLGSILGTLLIHALDMSVRSSDILNIRGYRGGISHQTLKKGLSRHDALPLMLGFGIILGALILR